MKNNFILLFLVLPSMLFAQAGLSISPGKMFFREGKGAAASQKIRISNPNTKAVEVGVSLSDWNYTDKGVNHIENAGTLENSCAAWIQVLPSSYFVVEPNEVKEVEVLMNVPADLDTSESVHTAMVFFTQLNPGDAVDENGAAIKVTVRMGLKVYHALADNQESVSITDIRPGRSGSGDPEIEVFFENDGELWSDGRLSASIFSQQTGAKREFKEVDFYSLPKDKRSVGYPIPTDLEKGKYTFIAQLAYGKENAIKVAEIDFEL